MKHRAITAFPLTGFAPMRELVLEQRRLKKATQYAITKKRMCKSTLAQTVESELGVKPTLTYAPLFSVICANAGDRKSSVNGPNVKKAFEIFEAFNPPVKATA